MSDTYMPAADRYNHMSYNRVGRSGLQLPELSLGLWQNFGQNRPLENQRDIIRRAFDLGITHFDLANNYGPPPGSAEANFGQIFARDLRSHRDEIIISSKAGYHMWEGPYGEWGSRKNLLASLDQSLGRLGIPYVDIFYSHRFDPETPLEETMTALADAVRSGKALYVGVSNYLPHQTVEAAAILAKHKVPLTIHQPSYSMFNRHIEKGLLPVLEKIGAGSIVFSPLQQGLLTDRYLDGTVPENSRVATGQFLSADSVNSAYLERARKLDAIAKGRGQTLAQLALTWVLRHRQVTSAVVGASSIRQLESNVAAFNSSPLNSEELALIEPFAVDGTGLY